MAKSAQKTSYKNLIVYQKAKQLTVDVIKYFSKFKFPKTQEFDERTNELVKILTTMMKKLEQST